MAKVKAVVRDPYAGTVVLHPAAGGGWVDEKGKEYASLPPYGYKFVRIEIISESEEEDEERLRLQKNLNFAIPFLTRVGIGLHHIEINEEWWLALVGFRYSGIEGRLLLGAGGVSVKELYGGSGYALSRLGHTIDAISGVTAAGVEEFGKFMAEVEEKMERVENSPYPAIALEGVIREIAGRWDEFKRAEAMAYAARVWYAPTYGWGIV